jgi:hypothetical protein
MRPDQNDPDWPFGRRVEPREYQELLGTLATEVGRDGGRRILVIAPRRGESEGELSVLLQYSRATGVVAHERGLQVLAAHSRFRNAHAAGEPDPPWFIGDWWHPSAHGHQLLAEWLAPMVLDPYRDRGTDAGLGSTPATDARVGRCTPPWEMRVEKAVESAWRARDPGGRRVGSGSAAGSRWNASRARYEIRCRTARRLASGSFARPSFARRSIADVRDRVDAGRGGSRERSRNFQVLLQSIARHR